MKRFDFSKVLNFRIGMILFTLFALMFYGNDTMKYTKYLKKLNREASIVYNSGYSYDSLHEKELIKKQVDSIKRSIFGNIGRMLGVFMMLMVYLKYNKK